MASGRRRFWYPLLIAASLITAACGDDPPDMEMQQAQRAIDAARAADADRYAHDELTAADEAIKRARDAVTQRDYRLALSNAIESRERAESAAKDAAARKAAAQAEAQRALAGAAATLAQTKARLRAKESAHAPPRILAEARRGITAADEAVQKAGAAFAQGDYREVTKALNGITGRLAAVRRDLDAATGAAPRRRR